MMKTYAMLNPIARAGLERLPEWYEEVENAEEAQAILVRSALMNDMQFSDRLECIARAGAGVSNIPVDRCAEEGIVVFNAPGANANGVKELVILGLVLAARDIQGGMKWIDAHRNDENLSDTMEKAKAKYAGYEIKGKTLGVIGLGAVGVLVANAAVALGMEVIGYDPYLSVSHALHLSHHIAVVNSVDRLYEAADYITIHVPENDATEGMLNAEAFRTMKDGTALLNFANAGLVNDDDLEEAIASGRIRKYVTDVPDYRTANMDKVIAFPHLGASTEESETNCALMAVDEMIDFMENGNITNSVNYPAISLGMAMKPQRICVAHQNVPNVFSALTTVLGSVNANISDMVAKSRGRYGFVIFDMDSRVSEADIEKIRKIPEVIRVRVIEK